MNRQKLHVISKCEVCNQGYLEPVLNLGLHPMCDDLVSIGDSRECVEYPIEILFCKKCITAHQKYQIPKQDLFPNSYHYRSRFTNDVLRGMHALVDSCINQYGDLNGKIVLDVGCNDGSLLDFFNNSGATTIGIEPTDAFLDAKEKGHFIYPNYLSQEIANEIVSDKGKPDFITFTNVFAHIQDLNEVIQSLKLLSKSSTKIIIENHYLGSIFQGNQFDTFYHEHPRTYSYNSFKYIAKSLGLSIENIEFPSRYGGNIRVFLGSDKKSVHNSELDENESKFLQSFIILNENINKWKKTKEIFFHDYKIKYGKIKAKAFPGRSAILIKMLGLDENYISAVYEKPGSMKIGQYVPGTRIPIYSDDVLFEQKVKNQPILNLAWHISSEIEKYLKENGYEGKVINILSNGDFN